MNESASTRSPWWYRKRGLIIGLVYFGGYALSAIRGAGLDERPVFVVLGARLAGGHGDTIVLVAAIASAIVAWVLRASGTAYLRSDVVFAADVQHDRLIVAGPFRYVRNPLYLGNVFLALSACVLATPLGALVIVLGNSVLVVLLARQESGVMAARYGEAYRAFRSAVPAFLPRLTPAHVPGSISATPTWGAALFNEAFSLLFGVALVPMALLGEGGVRAFWAIFVPTFVVFSALGWWASRKRTTPTA